jgi:hypothetical protein
LDDFRKLLNHLKNMPPPPRLSPILNREIDRFLHRDDRLAVIDSLAHMVVEQADSMIQSIHKTLKYNMDKLLKLS